VGRLQAASKVSGWRSTRNSFHRTSTPQEQSALQNGETFYAKTGTDFLYSDATLFRTAARGARAAARGRKVVVVVRFPDIV
jgi:hypothetical protein